MNNSAKVAALFLTVPGVIAPFLPFVYDVSPLGAVLRGYPYALLGLPILLGIPISIWQAYPVRAADSCPFAIVAAYVLSIASLISVLLFTITVVMNSGMNLHAAASVTSCWLLVIANVILVRRNLATSISQSTAAGVSLLGSYLSNAVFCLIAFGWDPWIQLQIGALAVAIACISYFVTIVLMLRSEDAQQTLVTARQP